MPFEVAIYTDVSASEAIDGVDGFNFQAVSPGVTAVDQQRIREGLLHRVVRTWSIDNDELSHPPTCAYVVHDGRCYLARGCSTGVTNSGRPGNQLTQTIVTSDTGDFVPYRPAQLYGAREWTLEKAARSELRAWVTPVELRPEFEVSALEEVVRADEWAAWVLPHFLTMLGEAVATEPTKLILVGRDVEVVMRWIALGTLFVDTDVASSLQFRALVDDPWHANAEIVGVSPEFDNVDLSAANVLDLERRAIPQLTPSATSEIWAAWFLQHGADDALNAIEIARRWQAVLGLELAHDVARIVALAGGAGDDSSDWTTSMTAIERLGDAGLRDDLALYADELHAATARYEPGTEDEFRLAGRAIREAHDAGVDELAARVVLSTLQASAAAPVEAVALVRELSTAELPITWESAGARRAAGTLLGDVMVAAPSAALPEVFAGARIVGAPVPDATLRAATANLAALWLAEPTLGIERWRRWLSGESVLLAVVDHLLVRLRAGERAAMVAMLKGSWDFLGPLVADADVTGWLAAARLGRVPLEDRVGELRRASRTTPDAWRIALAGSSLPADAVLWAAWIARHGVIDDMASSIRRNVERALASRPAAEDAPDAGDWNPLMRRVSTTGDPELARLAVEYREARAALIRARESVGASDRPMLAGCLTYVEAWAPLLLDELGALVVESVSSEEIGRLLDAASPWGHTAVRDVLVVAPQNGRGVAAIAFALRNRNHPQDAIAAACADALREIVHSRPDVVDRAQAEPSIRHDLKQYLRPASPSSRRDRKVHRPFGRGKEQ